MGQPALYWSVMGLSTSSLPGCGGGWEGGEPEGRGPGQRRSKERVSKGIPWPIRLPVLP